MSLLNSVEWAPGQADDVAGELDHRALHPQADAEERNLPLAGKADRLDLAFDAALAEAAGHQHAVVAGQQPLGPFALDLLALDPLDADLRPVGDAGMVERLVDRLVGVAVLGVLADHGDADLVLGIAQPVQQLAPVVQVRACRPAGPAARRSARRACCRPGSAALRRSRNPCPSPR